MPTLHLHTWMLGSSVSAPIYRDHWRGFRHTRQYSRCHYELIRLSLISILINFVLYLSIHIITFLRVALDKIWFYRLQELIRNKAKSGQSCCLLEDAFSMLSNLPWRAENLQHVSLIENYPAPLKGLGEPIRQVAHQLYLFVYSGLLLLGVCFYLISDHSSNFYNIHNRQMRGNPIDK